jgi:molecular chaperone GrpE
VRKRAARDTEKNQRFAVQALVESLAPALDSFDHAMDAFDADHDAAAVAEGMGAIQRQIEQALEAHGVQKLVPLGEPFDPNFHEALGVGETEAYPDNTVIQVLQNGWMLHDRLVRPARVRVARNPAGGA